MNFTNSLLVIFVCFVLLSCHTQQKIQSNIQINHRANQDTLLASPDLNGAHIGFVVYDPSNKKFLYNYQGDKYFIPASNIKIVTCYTAMKFLGDSLLGLRYVVKPDSTVEVEANGDPTFLHPDFINQPAYNFLKKQKTILLTDDNWKSKGWGMGWSWDDYESDYMAQRSIMPIYGNVVHFNKYSSPTTAPLYFQKLLENGAGINNGMFEIKRDIGANRFSAVPSTTIFGGEDIPFYTGDQELLINLLEDTLHNKVSPVHFKIDRYPDVVKIYTQPTDSMLKIMMHRSDNFFAEQSLLMVSNELLAEMSTSKIIDSLLKTTFSFLPQKPKWVDGSGLSRYNLFTPEDFVAILNKMKEDFAWDRITNILASGGSGTLGNYYKNSSGKIYAKTGSLSNNVALSGYLITKAGNTLTFSVLVSNYTGNGSNIRRSVERFLNYVMDNQ
jgi:D-alanyl-D-alanine carboxypeptidase/D-alanyl-D-alanine-endopeptidase (penicillin-binding protein 4)